MFVPVRLVRVCILVFCLFSISSPVFSQTKHRTVFLKSHSAKKISKRTAQKKASFTLDEGDAGYFYLNADESSISPGADITVNIYSNYDGVAPQLTGKLSLSFSNVLTYVWSSQAPATVTPGKIEWNINQAKGTTQLTTANLHLPNVGDTIRSLKFYLQLNTSVIDSGNLFVQQEANPVDVIHTDQEPKGVTKGVKWLRTKRVASTDIREIAADEAIIYSVDTSANGKYLFVSGIQNATGDEDDNNSIQYLAKYTLDGLSVWERYQLKGDTYLGLSSLKHTSDGGVILLTDTAIYDPLAHDYDDNSTGVLIKKWDSTGSLLWRKFIKCSDWPEVNFNNVSVLPNDDMVIAFSSDSKDGDIVNSLPDTTGQNVVIVKLSAAGNIMWHKVYGGDRDDSPYMIRVLQNGEIIVSGITQSTTGTISGFTGEIDPSDYHDEGFDAFVLKMDANGALLWSKTFSLIHGDYLIDMVETQAGYLFIGFAETYDQHQIDSLKNGASMWLLGLDANGSKISENVKPIYHGYDGYGGDFYSGIFCLQKTNDGNYIVGGLSGDKYGAIKTFHGREDVIIAKVSPAGNILWQKQVGGTSHDYLYSMILDKKGDIYFGGFTASSDDDIYENTSAETTSMLIGKIGITNTISGKVFIDKNGNHIQDAGESLFNEGRISSYKNGDTTIARIFNGHYLNNVDTGTYVTAYSSINDYYTPYPVQQSTVFNSFDQEATVDIALVPKPGIKDLQVSLTATTPARPGFDAGFRIITKNMGTENIAGAVVKLKKPSTVTYLNGTRTTSFITADTITFSAKNMTAGFADTLDINVKLATPPTINNGDTLTFTAIAQPQATDTTPVNNQSTLREVARGSFDPNDKTEAHAGVYTPTMQSNGEPFQYLIRFQNTGTDTAFYVTVKDTLSNKLDLKSLEIISTSHPYTFTLDGNIATWQFNMIKLVDSTTNEAKSHGYISFTVRPKTELQPGDTVNNTAAIYFDYNLPVITNSARLMMVSDQTVLCPGSTTQFSSNYTGVSYQWQVNTGSGFTNIINNAQYSGAATANLLLKNIPSSWYGYEYKCVVTMAGGKIVNSNTYKLTFVNTWTGTTSNAWETASNWSCGSVPDQYTDVVIRSNAIRQPEVNSTTGTCRSINANAGSHVWIKGGAKLNVTGK